MLFGLTYSATCQIYWVIRDSPVLSPDRDILCFTQKRLIELSKICSVKCNEMQLEIHFIFFGGVSRLIFSIRMIYGWLGWADKIKYPGSV